VNRFGRHGRLHWEPRGERIAFVAGVPSGLVEDEVEFHYPYWHVVMTMSTDGSDLRQLAFDYFARRPDWTPDSRRILYTNYGEGYRNYCPRRTYSVAADGSEGTVLVPAGLGTCFEYHAVRSPNGRRLALWSYGPMGDDG
jgi:Tol biopolymer transport system component